MKAIVTAGPAAILGLAARPAAAFRVLPFEDYSALIEEACRPSSEHAQLLAAALQSLEPGLEKSEIERVLRGLTCPTCGCPLAAFQDLGSVTDGQEPAAPKTR